MELIYTTTTDDLRLPGMHYPSDAKDMCVILIHGMSGFILENYFGHVLGETISQQRFGYMYTHNRGYAHINDIRTSEKKADGGYVTKRMGAVYERFAGCIEDIDAWLVKGRELGYKRFVIIGHSLGAPKVVHHYYKRKPTDVVGMVLLSPGDMAGLVRKPEYQPNFEELLEEARANVKDGKPEKLLSGKVWDWYVLSSQTFLDLFEEGGPADNLPILRNPDAFPELASVSVPVLCVMGEHDDVVIRSLPEDMELLKSKATAAISFENVIIPGANHGYEGKEEELVQSILTWLKNN